MPYAAEQILQDSDYVAHLLAQKVMPYKNRNTIVVGVGPGGSSVGPSLAKELNLPFEVVLCRELKHPADEKKVIGAVSENMVVMNIDSYDIPQNYLMRQVAILKHEIENDYKLIYGNKPKPSFSNKTIIPVADVLTSPESILAGIKVIKSHTPLQVIVAVPVVAPHAAAKVAGQVNDLVFLHIETGNLKEVENGEKNSHVDLLKIKNSINLLKSRQSI